VLAQENVWTEEEWTEKFIILHNEELHDLHRSPNTVRILKFREL
jgi:hypothetical protein